MDGRTYDERTNGPMDGHTDNQLDHDTIMTRHCRVAEYIKQRKFNITPYEEKGISQLIGITF